MYVWAPCMCNVHGSQKVSNLELQRVSYKLLCRCSLCDKAFPGEMQHTQLFHPDRKPTTDPCTNNIKVQLGQPGALLGFTGIQVRSYRNDWRQLHHQGPPQHGWLLTKAGKPGTRHSLRAGSSLGQKTPFPSDSGLHLFQAAWLGSFLPLPGSGLVSESSLQLRLSEIFLQFSLLSPERRLSAFIIYSGREGAS